MSLLRLLTSGRCLVGSKDSEIRYRMRQSHLLPKFGSSRNPFVVRKEPAEPAPMNSPVEPPPAAPLMDTVEPRATSPEAARPLPPTVSAGKAAKTIGAGLLDRVRQVIRRLSGKLNPFLRRSAPVPSVRNATPAGSQSPVQGELSLDKIKVVRNDLNDADVEIVPASIGAKRKAASPAKTNVRQGLAATQAG